MRRAQEGTRHQRIRTYAVFLLQLLTLIAVYYVVAMFGLHLNAVSGYAAAVWPPTGVAIASLFLFGKRLWPGLLIAAALVNLTLGATPFVALAIGTGNMLEALLAVMLLQRVPGFDPSFEKIRSVAYYILIAAIASPLVSSTIGVSSLIISGIVHPAAFGQTWLTWWLGDALGAALVGPFLLAFAYRRPIEFDLPRFLEWVLYLCVVTGFSTFLFFDLTGWHFISEHAIYLLFPLFVWPVLRFGTRTTTLSVLIVAITAVAGTVLGQGPFVHGDANQNLLFLVVFIGSVTVTELFLTAVVAENKASRREVENLNRGLEARVERQTQQILQEKEKDEAILESIGEGVFAVDMRNNITMLNPVAAKLFLISEKEAVGRPYEELFPLADGSGRLLGSQGRPIEQAKKTKQSVRVAANAGYHYFLPDQRVVPVALTAAPIYENGKLVGVVEVFRDATDEVQVERAKTDFVALASHQLRTPMTSIRWNAESLYGALSKHDRKKERTYAAAIRESVQRMNGTIDILLNVSKIELGTFVFHPEPVNVKAQLETVLRELEPHIREKRLKIKKKFASNIPEIEADPDLLHIVLQNVCSNSVKYSPEGETITVSIAKERRVLTISVDDRGYGIPEAQRDQIFTKLFRADNARLVDPDGSGLGLYLAKLILDQVGGRIWFDANVTRGTVFYISLPLSGMLRKRRVPLPTKAS